MTKSHKTSTLLFAGLSTLLLSSSANAIGFGAGLELGGFAGGAGVTTGLEPSLYGGGGALLLSLELYDEGLLRVQSLARLEGNGFGIGSSAGAGAGGAGGAEGLLRLGFDLPVVEPFVELGGGAAVAAGGGTTNLSDVSGATGEAVGGNMWVPAGYLGLGLTMALPLLPYFELRVGSHVGSLMALDPPAPIPLTGVEALSARGEVWLGVGYRI